VTQLGHATTVSFKYCSVGYSLKINVAAILFCFYFDSPYSRFGFRILFTNLYSLSIPMFIILPERFAYMSERVMFHVPLNLTFSSCSSAITDCEFLGRK